MNPVTTYASVRDMSLVSPLCGPCKLIKGQEVAVERRNASERRNGSNIS